MLHFTKSGKYDLTSTVVPLVVVLLMILFVSISPDLAGDSIDLVRGFLSEELGSYYLLLGFSFVIISLYIAFSKYGKIKLGEGDPKFSTLSWAFMIFTSTMAADILFYSLHEWIYYWNVNPLDCSSLNTQEKVVWSETYSLFHWGITPWIFYILPATAYAYMMHVKKINRQKISEACRPVLGKSVDSWQGKVIDIVSVVALLLATSTTFSVATPLLSSALTKVLGIDNSPLITVGILATIVVIYTVAVVTGFKGISRVSSACVAMFMTLIVLFLANHNFRFIVENAINSLGNLTQNFVRLSTWTDPTRSSRAPQDWTIFYWAYWIAWSIANPFFIAKISEGRTVKQLVLGGTLSGVSCTFLSFTVFGGFGIAEQVATSAGFDQMMTTGTASEVILQIFDRLPLPRISLLILVLAMIGFYASTFDALTHVIASYSYKELSVSEEPGKVSKIYWSVLFAALPCALLFSERTSHQLQGLSIVAAFPISILMIVVVVSFFKNVRKEV